MKKVYYLLFAFFFNVFKLFPVNPKKITFVLSHDTNLTGNMGFIYNEILRQKLNYRIEFFSRNEYEFNKKLSKLFTNALKVFVIKNYHMATSKIVILDNVFLASAYFSFKKNVKVIQVWHASGVLKKFGLDACFDEKQKSLIKKANKNITNVVVNSSSFVEIFARAFHVKKDIILPLGAPRTDFFFDKNKVAEAKKLVFIQYPKLRGKKVILYAPTFREHELFSNNRRKELHLDIEKLYKVLYPEYILAVRLHPRISYRNIENYYPEFVVNVSGYKDINHLLAVSDILITDYSSLITEYALLNRPIIFYPYDLDEYESKERGFYYSYADFVPGPIVLNEEELIQTIKKNQFDINRIENYTKLCFDYFDGKASERFVDHFLK